MANLSKAQLTQMKNVGIVDVKTVEEAREAMISYLNGKEIEGVEEDSYDDLHAMVEVMYKDSDDELDTAVEEKNKKSSKTETKSKSKSKKQEEPEDEDEDEDEEEEDEDDGVSIDEMRKALIKSGRKEREVKKMKDKAVQEAYNELVESAEEEDEEEVDDEEEEEKPAAKSKGKDSKASKTSKKKPEPDDDDEDEEDEDEKPVKEKAKKSNTTPAGSAKSGKAKVVKETKKIDPLHNAEDAKMFEPYIEAITKLLKGQDIQFDFLAKSGIVVRLVGANSKRVIFCFNSFKYNAAGKPVGKFYFPTVRGDKGRELLEEVFGDDIDIFEDWSGKLKIKEMPLADVPGALKANKEILVDIISKMSKKDDKLGKNRQKMEEDLKDNKKDKVADIKNKAKGKDSGKDEKASTKTKAKEEEKPSAKATKNKKK